MNPLGILLSQALPRGKPDIVEPLASRPDPLGGLLPAIQVVGALLVVVAILKFAMPRVLAKWAGDKRATDSKTFRVEETIAFAGGHLYVVSLRGRTLLLAGGAQGVQYLTDLPEPEREPEAPAFFELVDAARSQPHAMAAAMVESEHPELDEDESRVRARQALSRLRRIAQ